MQPWKLNGTFPNAANMPRALEQALPHLHSAVVEEDQLRVAGEVTLFNGTKITEQEDVVAAVDSLQREELLLLVNPDIRQQAARLHSAGHLLDQVRLQRVSRRGVFFTNSCPLFLSFAAS